MPPLRVLPLRSEDIHAVTLLRLAALEQTPYHTPFWNQLHGKSPRDLVLSSQEKGLRSAFEEACLAPNRQFFKIVDGEGDEAELVSYCQWHAPIGDALDGKDWSQKEAIEAKQGGAAKEDKPTAGQDSLPTSAYTDGAMVDALKAINAEEAAMNDRMWRKDNLRCFRLTHLMTHPKHQGRGAASLLIKHGLALADAAHLPTVLQADPPGYKLYQKFGFEDFGVWSVDLAKFGGEGVHYNTAMVRKAR